MANTLPALLISAILIAISLSIGHWSRARSLPLLVHNVIWVIAFVAIGSDLIEYHEISATAWLVILTGLLAFNVGYLACTRNPNRSITQDRPALVRSGAVFALLLGLYALGFTVYLLVIHRYFGISKLFTDPTSIRAARDTPYLALVPLWARLLLFLGPLIFALLVTPRGLEMRMGFWKRVLLSLVLIGTMLLQLQRASAFIAILWAVSVWLFAIKGLHGRSIVVELKEGVAQVPARTALIAGLGATVVGLLSFQVVALALGKTGTQALSTGAVSQVLENSGLTSVMVYGTSGIVAFGELVDSTNSSWPPTDVSGPALMGDYNPVTWGGATFDYAVEVLPVVKPWPGIAPFVDVPIRTNVYTWFESLFRDFRTPGVVVGMLLTGLAVAATYQARDTSNAAFWIGSLLLSVVLLSTFAGRFNSVVHIFSGFAAFALAWISDITSRSAPSLVNLQPSAGRTST